jgi:hypothetical protein
MTRFERAAFEFENHLKINFRKSLVKAVKTLVTILAQKGGVQGIGQLLANPQTLQSG